MRSSQTCDVREVVNTECLGGRVVESLRTDRVLHIKGILFVAGRGKVALRPNKAREPSEPDCTACGEVDSPVASTQRVRGPDDFKPSLNAMGYLIDKPRSCSEMDCRDGDGKFASR